MSRPRRRRRCTNCGMWITWGVACNHCMRAFLGGIAAALGTVVGTWLGTNFL